MRLSCILFTFLLLLAACQSKSKEALLYKKWQMVYDLPTQIQALDSVKRAMLDSLPKKAQAKALKLIEEQVEKNTFQFKKDHSFELITKGNELVQTGSWKLKNDKTLILMQESPKSYNELIIQKLDKDTLILSSPQKNGEWKRTIFVTP